MTVISTMKDQIYQIILKRIIGMDYLPGEKISEKDLVEELEVGRTPIREALLQLRQEGLINAIPQSGTYISKINLQLAKDARFVRESVEMRVVKEAVDKLTTYDYVMLQQIIDRQGLIEKGANKNLEFFQEDEAFHHYFYSVTGHEQVWIWLQSVNMHLNRFRFLRLQSKNLSWNSLVDEHRQLLKAVKNKDDVKSVAWVSEHLHRMLDEEPTLVKTFPEYFEDTNNNYEQ